VPPPRFNLVRYHGVLARSAAWRPLIIPSEPEPEIADLSSHPNSPAEEQILSDTQNLMKKSACRPRNNSWVELMRRVFDRRFGLPAMRRSHENSMRNSSTGGNA
jgi:hypothetical protein